MPELPSKPILPSVVPELQNVVEEQQKALLSVLQPLHDTLGEAITWQQNATHAVTGDIKSRLKKDTTRQGKLLQIVGDDLVNSLAGRVDEQQVRLNPVLAASPTTRGPWTLWWFIGQDFKTCKCLPTGTPGPPGWGIHSYHATLAECSNAAATVCPPQIGVGPQTTSPPRPPTPIGGPQPPPQCLQAGELRLNADGSITSDGDTFVASDVVYVVAITIQGGICVQLNGIPLSTLQFDIFPRFTFAGNQASLLALKRTQLAADNYHATHFPCCIPPIGGPIGEPEPITPPPPPPPPPPPQCIPGSSCECPIFVTQCDVKTQESECKQCVKCDDIKSLPGYKIYQIPVDSKDADAAYYESQCGEAYWYDKAADFFPASVTDDLANNGWQSYTDDESITISDAQDAFNAQLDGELSALESAVAELQNYSQF